MSRAPLVTDGVREQNPPEPSALRLDWFPVNKRKRLPARILPASLLHRREADFGYQFAKPRGLVQGLEVGVGRQRGEQEVVALVGDFEILHGFFILAEGCAERCQFKR